MPRTRAKKTEIPAAETETLPPGATDFEPMEYESAADFRAANGIAESVAGDHHVE